MRREIPEEDLDLRHQWNTMVEGLDHPQVFYTCEWAIAVQRAYKVQLPPLVFLGYDDGNLCGVAAFAINRRRRQASFLCATTGDYCDFLSPPGVRSEFVAAVLGELKKERIERIALANLPADSPTNEALRAAAASHDFHMFARTAYDCAQIALDRLERTKDGSPRVPGQSRVRKLEKMVGRVRTEHRRLWQDVQPVLPEFIRAHVGRFLQTGRISILADPARQLFLEELGKLLSEHNWIVMTRFLVEGRPAAWHYGFNYHKTWFWYQPTFDTSLEKHSPGSCLLSAIIQDAIDSRAISVVDLGLGAEGYKANFANASRETLYITLHQSRSEYWATRARFRLATAVRSSPGLEKFAERTRDSVRRFRTRVRESGIGGTLAWLANRILGSVWSQTQVNFYRGERAMESSVTTQESELIPLRLEHLAEAAMLYREDQGTSAYLVRAANRLRDPQAEGYVLIDAAGHPVHFAWVSPFNGFYCAELNSTLDASSESMMLFDCWTPSAQRGRGWYEKAITRLRVLMQVKDKEPWIFGAKNNVPSVKGIERAGFQLQYRLVRKLRFGCQTLAREAATGTLARASEAAARV